MWQEILIIIIGVTVASYTVWKIIQFFTKKDASPCSGCNESCAIKNIHVATKENCKKINE